MNLSSKHTPIPRNGPPGPSNTGPVTYSHMSKEEIEARYGHIKPQKRRGLVRW